MDEEVRRRSDGRRFAVGLRAVDVKGREKAFAAARYAIANNANREDAVAKFDTNGTSVSEAILALNHATPAELADCEANKIGLKELVHRIRKRVPKEARERKKIVLTETETDKLRFESKVWAELRSALEAISNMPRAADVATLCRRNRQRKDIVDRHLMTAFGWITEFSDDWTK